MTVFFYEETLGALEKHGHKPEEVKYVFNKDFYCSWETSTGVRHSFIITTRTGLLLVPL